MKKVLIVSPSFFPDRTVAAARMSSLVNYLVEKGEKVIVLTNKKHIERESLEKNLEFRYVTVNKNKGYVSFRFNAKQYYNSVLKILNTEQIQTILISMGPFYTSCISKIAKRQRIKVLLDFRDPWSFDFREETFKSFIKKIITFPLKYIMECDAIRNADLVTTVTPDWVREFKLFHPFHKNKICLVENGYDDVKLDNITSNMKPNTEYSSKLLIGVFGKLFYYTERYSEIFLNALKNFDYSEVVIYQVGEPEKHTKELLKSHKLSENLITSTGFLDYEIGMSILNSCNCLLIIDSRKKAIGTKIYDYIYLRKPILYIGPDNSAIAKIVKKIPKCFVCSTVDQVLWALDYLVKNKSIEVIYNKDFSRTSQNKKMYELIKGK